MKISREQEEEEGEGRRGGGEEEALGSGITCNTLVVVKAGHRNELFILRLPVVYNHDVVASPQQIIVISSA